jgi:hypothetical protein
LVAQKNAYRNILITFTNKAVHEKSRIVGSLSEFAKDEPSKANDLMQDLADDTLSIIQIKN